MSGSRLTAMTREEAVKPSDQLLAKLSLTRKDIRQLQFAKGSIATGIQVLMKEMGVGPDEAPVRSRR
jgi:uncharacterized 2Fe-2S/4Fe-4S cluster protein (DUF4445 family)